MIRKKIRNIILHPSAEKVNIPEGSGLTHSDMARYTLAEIIKSYSQKKEWEKQLPVNYFIFRPLSHPLTYLLLLITDSPSLVAWAGFAVGSCGIILLALIPEVGPWPGIALVALFSLLDAVDGNIARVTGNVSRYGMLLDSFLGMIVESGYCFAIGIGFYRATGDVVALLCGCAITAGYLYSAAFAEAYTKHWVQTKDGQQVEADIHKPLGSSRYRNNPLHWLFINLNTVNVQLCFLAPALLWGKIDLFLLVFSLYYIVRAMTIFAYYVRAAGRTLV